MIRHHEQINELKECAHGDLSYIDCHNPHERAILVGKNICAECHEEIAESYAEARHGQPGTACFECHFPKASKSAISVATYNGDVCTHLIWKSRNCLILPTRTFLNH